VKVLALEHDIDGVDAAGFTAALLRAEARRVWELWQAGTVREVCFRADQHRAVLVLEVADLDEAHRVLDGLPLVQAGLIRFEVIGLTPYPGFSRLFEPPADP
jgi:hypothetical protein